MSKQNCAESSADMAPILSLQHGVDHFLRMRYNESTRPLQARGPQPLSHTPSPTLAGVQWWGRASTPDGLKKVAHFCSQVSGPDKALPFWGGGEANFSAIGRSIWDSQAASATCRPPAHRGRAA